MEISKDDLDILIRKLKYGLKAKDLDMCKDDIRVSLEYIRNEFNETCSSCGQVIKDRPK